MSIEYKETEVLKSIYQEIEKIIDARGSSNSVILRPTLTEIQIMIDRALKDSVDVNGFQISLLDVERNLHRFHRSLQDAILSLAKLEREVIDKRTIINSLLSDNFSTCHNCKGKKKIPVEDDSMETVECNFCNGRGVLQK